MRGMPTLNGGKMLDLVRFQKQELPKAAGAEDVIFSASEMIRQEKKLQRALLGIKEKYGRNSILRGASYEEGATARERNGQIGGHRA